MEAAFKPQVNDELDTQNFMKFDEVSKFPSLTAFKATPACAILQIQTFPVSSLPLEFWDRRPLFIVHQHNLV